MICLSSLLLTGCGITPEIDIGNSEYQIDTSDTGTVDTGGTVATEGAGTVSNINNDKTPPVVTITLPGTGEYILDQSITAIWSATDDLSGVVSPASGSVSIDTSSEGTKTFTLPAGAVKDKAGNHSLKVTKSYKVIKSVIGVDTTKPVITGSRAPLANSFGWNNTDVTVSFICADTGSVQSGIAINTVAGKTLTTEGKDQSVTNTGVYIDVAGNTADPVTVSNINIDKTPPVVTITLPGNGKYGLNKSITATWSATDALSGAEDSKAPKTIKIDTKSVGKKKITLPAGIVKDKAGNSSQEVTTFYEVLEADTTKPVITGSRDPLPNSFGWNNTDITVNFSCADIGSVQSGIDINTVVGKTLTTEGKDQSVTNTGTCIDVAGNTADPATVSNINIDKTPPVVTITLPVTGEYVLNQLITATWFATDALSGVVSPDSGFVLIDTSSVGTKTFTLPAGTVMDKAGNSSLKVTISYSVSVIENTEEPVMWSGLGMQLFSTWDTSKFDSYVDDLLANGFTEIRMDGLGYTEWSETYGIQVKAAVIRAVAKGINVIWGICSGGVTLTSSNWDTYAAAVLVAAQWSQDNGVFEFQLGNEEEYFNDDDTLTDAQLITNLKSLATDVQAIFTNGNVSYPCAQDNVTDWVSAGKGDIDILACNLYMTWGTIPTSIAWKDKIDALVGAFGTEGTYLTEFGPNTSGLDYYSEDETVQAAAVTEMIEYIKDSGMTRAIFFCYIDTSWLINFGVRKDDGTYRLLWSQALLNSESVKFATVPTKTTTISLPNTIALLPKITI